jgi:hypothetical protein
MERLNQPNPIPQLAAPTDRKAVEDADYEITNAADDHDGAEEKEAATS